MIKYRSFLKKFIIISLYYCFHIFKVNKNIVMFTDFYGDRFTNDIEEIFRYLHSKYSNDLRFIIVYNDHILNTLPINVKVVRRFSPSHIYYAAIAGIRVNSCHETLLLKKRGLVLNIQTWHGTPLKKIGLQVDGKAYSRMRRSTRIDSATWDLLVAPNAVVKKIYCAAFLINESNVVIDQLPREGLLLKGKNYQPVLKTASFRSQIPAKEQGKKLCLYAPTFRDGDISSSEVKFSVKKFHKIFGDEFILGVRLHSNIVNTLPADVTKYLVDFSKFNDLSVLLNNTDVLISDYSSIMFDFECLNRPIIKYAYDFNDYTNRLRGLNFDYLKIPGSIAYTEQDLFDCLSAIKNSEFQSLTDKKVEESYTGRFYQKLDDCIRANVRGS